MKEQYFKKGAEHIPPGGFPVSEGLSDDEFKQKFDLNIMHDPVFSKILEDRKAKKEQNKQKLQELNAETLINNEVHNSQIKLFRSDKLE